MILRTLLLAPLLSVVISELDIDDQVFQALADSRELADETDECTCVPYYLCQDNEIITDGRGLINLRIRKVCENSIDTCCKVPRTTTTIPPTSSTTYEKRKSCGRRNPEGVGDPVTGHNISEARFGEFPWMVALMMTKAIDGGSKIRNYVCGGALIHQNVILTAAHCVTKKSYNWDEMVARAGEWDTQRETEIFPHQDRKVIRTIIHPGFQKVNLWNDFALLVVDQPFTFAENVDTVCLPSPGAVPLSRECYANGWGKVQFGKEGKSSKILKKIDLPIVPKDRCTDQLQRTRLGRYFTLHESFVCAGGIIGKDTCKGDGGSPLVCPVEGKPGTYEVTGLVSWGIGCANEIPAVYAGVAYALPWIDRTMTELGYPLQ